MTEKVKGLIDKLQSERKLALSEYRCLIDGYDEDTALYARERAHEDRYRVYGDTVFIRGLIEISNICKNNCLYCGIRGENKNCQRYRLCDAEILECCREGYALGFRTFVLQGGEDGYFTDRVLCTLIGKIKSEFSDCAVTLSLGERSYESYKALRGAGADRYLLRHETADKAHYERLHPAGMSYNARMECLENLKALGFQTGCGFMVGSPYQTSETLAKDLKFIEEFSPEMCGIGPFIPQRDTPFGEMRAGDAGFTCYFLSLLRLIKPTLLIPSTTALGTIADRGRELGILSGANVVMPNLSPQSVRKKYALYDNKLSEGAESGQCLDTLKKKIKSIGYRVVVDRGDIKTERK